MCGMPIFVPLAAVWVAQEERTILASGRELNEAEKAMALEMGVKNPERVRVKAISAIPLPGTFFLRMGWIAGFGRRGVAGLALSYGIYVRADYAQSRGLLAHELVHVGQYERLGGIRGFLRAYLWECARDGYLNSALEQEAITRSAGW